MGLDKDVALITDGQVFWSNTVELHWTCDTEAVLGGIQLLSLKEGDII